MMCEAACNYCLVSRKDMGLGGFCFKTSVRGEKKKKINSHFENVVPNIIVTILGNYSLTVKITFTLSL